MAPLLGAPYGALLTSAYDPEQHKRCYWEHPFDLYSNASSRQQCAALLIASELTETVIPTATPMFLAVVNRVLGVAAKAVTADELAPPVARAEPPPPPPPPPSPPSPPPPPPPAPEPTPVPPGVAVADPLPPGEETLVVNGVVKRNQVVPILLGVPLKQSSPDAVCVHRGASLAGTTSLGIQCEEGEFAQTGGCRGSSALFANHPHGDNMWVCEQMIAGVMQAFAVCCMEPEVDFEAGDELDGDEF
jgi:hypothetical protein